MIDRIFFLISAFGDLPLEAGAGRLGYPDENTAEGANPRP